MDLVHYTSFETGKSLASGDSDHLWYSNVVYVNDPEEGRILLDILDEDKDRRISQAYLAGESRSDVSVYLGSFLLAQADNESHEDDLVMWRTYGKSNNIEAAGCNLVLRGDFFKVLPEKISGEELSSVQSTGQELMQVIYYHKGKKSFVNIDPILKDKIDKQIKDLRELLKRLLEFRKKVEPDYPDLARRLEKIIFKEVSKVAYLFKSADYAYENEVRVVAYVSKAYPQIKTRDQKVEGAPPERFYIQSENVVLPFLKKIYLGAKVPYANQWSIYLDWKMRKTKQEKGEKKEYKELFKDFNPSNVSIIKSSCQFV